jgi:EmrB/QacA subfamily drug resistance transporter
MPLSPPIPGDAKRWRALCGVSIASFLGCIDFTIVNTVIPDIQADLRANVGQSQWIIAAFLMALCAFMVAAGRMADLHGRRRLLYLGMAAFGLASLGAGGAPGIGWLIAFRLAQGVSCAVLYTASAAIVSHAFPENERGRAIGILFGVNGLGLALGPVAGGFLVGAFGWRSVFLVNAPLIALSFAVCLTAVGESRDTEERGGLDWRGLALLAGAVAALMLGLGQGAAWGWASARTAAAFAGAAGLLALFIRAERAAAAPLLRIDLFTHARFVTAGIATAALAFFYCAAFFLMPLYLRIIGHCDGGRIGAMLLPATAVMALSSPLAGRLADRFGSRPLLLAGFLCFAASAALQGRFSIGTPTWFILAAFALMGLGWACILGPSTVAALASVPERLGGVATGAAWTLHNLGGAVGLAAATLVYQFCAREELLHAGGLPLSLGLGQAAALVADPAEAAANLARLGAAPAEAARLAAQAFVGGYQAAMGLLLAVSLAAFVAVAVGLRTPRREV